MSDEAIAAAGEETRGPEAVEDSAAGDQSDGAQDRSPDGDGAGETPANDSTHDNDSGDDADDLTRALADGSTDELDADGTKKAAEPEKAEPEAKDDAEKAKAEPVDADEKAMLDKARTNAQRKELKALFTERKKLREEAKEGTAAKEFATALIEHASSAGLVIDADGKRDFSGLRTLIEQEKHLKGQPPEKQAEYYRKLADSISPAPKQEPPKPVELSAELKEAVDAGFLSKDDAELLVRTKSGAAAKPQEPAKQPEAVTSGPSKEEVSTGYADVAKAATEYKTRFPADWESIAKDVQAEMADVLKDTHPRHWGKLAKQTIELVTKRRTPATKTPPKTLRPSNPAPKASEVLSEEEEARALARGELT